MFRFGWSLFLISKKSVCVGCGNVGKVNSWRGRILDQSFSHPYCSGSAAAAATATTVKSTRVKGNASLDSFMESLTLEETSKVLNVLNEAQRSEDLLKYFLPKKKAEELVKIKNGNGVASQISSVRELVSVVGPKSSTKFICSILDRPIPVTANSAMFPLVTAEDVKRISTVLSLVIVGDKISWSLVKRTKSAEGEHTKASLNVEVLKQLAYPFSPRMHFLTLLKEMEIIARQIPDADLYVTEEYPVSSPTPYMFNFQLQMGQAKSMLLGILSSRSNPPKMISIKTVAVARLFNTFVGSERVSGQHIVEDMLIDRKSMSLAISNSLLDSYFSDDVKVKEGLSHTLLLNLSYWKMTKQIS